jgi:indolepyruvate ferredoxin oxidoreductase
VRAAEQRYFPGRDLLTQAAIKYYFKLLAYKDEYEVARLHTAGGFLEQIAARFEGHYKLVFNLAPPLLSQSGGAGRPAKRAFGPWIIPVFRALAKLRFLRASALDPFKYSAERRLDRELIANYEENVNKVLSAMAATPPNALFYTTAAALLALPEDIRGYGPVRARHVEKARQREAQLHAALDQKKIILKQAA